MNGAIWFFLGLMTGGFVSILYLSLTQGNRINKYETQMFKLYEQMSAYQAKEKGEE